MSEAPFKTTGPAPTRDQWLSKLLEANEGLGNAQVRIAVAAGLDPSASADRIVAEIEELRAREQDALALLREMVEIWRDGRADGDLEQWKDARALVERAGPAGATPTEEAT